MYSAVTNRLSEFDASIFTIIAFCDTCGHSSAVRREGLDPKLQITTLIERLIDRTLALQGVRRLELFDPNRIYRGRQLFVPCALNAARKALRDCGSAWSRRLIVALMARHSRRQ